MKFEMEIQNLAIACAFSAASLVVFQAYLSDENEELCQAYSEANIGWIKDNAKLDKKGRYNFVHPDGTTCAVRLKAP